MHLKITSKIYSLKRVQKKVNHFGWSTIQTHITFSWLKLNFHESLIRLCHKDCCPFHRNKRTLLNEVHTDAQSTIKIKSCLKKVAVQSASR